MSGLGPVQQLGPKSLSGRHCHATHRLDPAGAAEQLHGGSRVISANSLAILRTKAWGCEEWTIAVGGRTSGNRALTVTEVTFTPHGRAVARPRVHPVAKLLLGASHLPQTTPLRADTLHRNATFHSPAGTLTFSSSHAAPVGWSRRSRDAFAGLSPESHSTWPQSGLGRTQREQERLQQPRRLAWLPGRRGLQRCPHSPCRPMLPLISLKGAAIARLLVVFRQRLVELRNEQTKSPS